ncbi:MAG: SMC-Scp complex subunit ScpB [Bryobacteraceae bacterium]
MTPPEQETAAAAEETALEMAPDELGVETQTPAEDTEAIRLRALVEAVVYVLEEPMPAAQIAQALNRPKEQIQAALDWLVAQTAETARGVAIREVAGGYKMSTKAEFHDEIRGFVKKLKPPLKLSLAALETLAVIAYKQPITAPEIQEIRGVQGTGVLKTLLERKLITAAGRKQVVGRPVLYKTTKDFLVQFGLKDLAELPTLKEFEEWSRLALGDSGDETVEETPVADPPASEEEPAAAEASSEAPGPEADAEPPAAESATEEAESAPAEAASAPASDDAPPAEDAAAAEDASAGAEVPGAEAVTVAGATEASGTGAESEPEEAPEEEPAARAANA